MPLLSDAANFDVSRSPSPSADTSRPIKRKLDFKVDEGEIKSKRSIKKRRSGKGKGLADDDETLDLERGINTAIGQMDSRLLTDWVAQQVKRFAPDLSMVELEDQYLPERALKDTSTWDKPRTLHDLPDYLKRYSRKDLGPRKLSSASSSLGSPHTLVITAAGLRAADAARTLRVFQTKEVSVAKLFAKHIKLKDAIKYVKKTRIGIGIGTPARLIDLLDAGALSSENLERIIIDCSHIDQKKRGIFDMKETQQSLMALLNRETLKSRYGKGKDGIDLLLY
ncbi:racA [Physcia stellaris]|nr:racA [Physcia stellaris]